MPVTRPASCPCGSGKSHATCCAPYLLGERPAPSAEALMRSRYCAYALGNAPYLLATWHPDTRPDRLDLEPSPTWLGLSVKAAQDQDASHATVAFVARYKVGGRGYRMAETSRFERIEGRWYYLDGDVR
ncbi:MAG TPA: YchJ family metal-binding protein [Thiobacillaceae bacterium]|nr:YchJ family metal-binding protein [Thiobacillaceae bacterium]HNH88617.1 YchJ family metal-binding protein [Thiobacillaceae bacterium]HNI08351.1 YchJ family metal-binding protein [Thiobacillaceae bacterium]